MQKRGVAAMIFPECWADDTRMDVMFAPFRLKAVNPENYEAKLKFWKDMVVRYCDHKGSPNFSLAELRRAFQRKNKLPYGLEAVIEDLQVAKALRHESEFINDPQNTWSGWAVNNFMKKPFQWGVQKLSSPTVVPEQHDHSYIHLDVLRQQSERLEKSIEIFAGLIVPIEKIEQLEDVKLSQEGLFMCLVQLRSLSKIYMEYKIENGQRKIELVKVPDKNCPITPITDTDRSIYALEKTEQSLLKMLDEMEAQMVEHENLARKNIREGKKLVAKSYLKKKHQVEKQFEKRSAALDNIQTILTRIHETRSNDVVLDAYMIGSKTLQSLLSSSTLNVDNIDEVVDNIKESLEIHDEVQQTLGTVQLTDKAEDSSLEQELLELMSDNKPPADMPKPYEPPKPHQKNEKDDSLLKQLEQLDIIMNLPEVPSPPKTTDVIHGQDLHK